MFRRIVTVDNMFKVTPPFLKLSKKPGPTCRPIQNTNRIKPKSCTKVRIGMGAVNPMCPAMIPVKSTNVTPSEIPAIYILPNNTPIEITKANNNAMWATDSVLLNR